MQRFKRFLLSEGFLTEGAFKEGSVIEGLFAIAVAQYLRDGEYDVSEIEKIRQQIEPSLFATKGAKFKMDLDPIWDQAPGKHPKTGKRYPKDHFDVSIEIELKEKEINGAYGKAWANALQNGPTGGFEKNFVSLNKKLNTMVKQIKKTKAQKRIDKYINDLLLNDTPDNVKLHVKAAGPSGESSGTTEFPQILKGDVYLEISSVTRGRSKDKKIKAPKIKPIAFSLKSDNTTLGNRSPWISMGQVAELMDKAGGGKSSAFGHGGFVIDKNGKSTLIPIALDDAAKTIDGIKDGKELNDYARFSLTKLASSDYYPNADRDTLLDLKRKVYDAVFDIISNRFVAFSKSSAFKPAAVNIVKLGAFGTDFADVIDFKTSSISEITKDNVDRLFGEPYSFYGKLGQQESNGRTMMECYIKIEPKVAAKHHNGVTEQYFWRLRQKYRADGESKVMFEVVSRTQDVANILYDKK